MPKSAPRRKRIRTARAEVDPTNLSSTTIASNNSSLKISAESSSSSSKQNKGQQSGKKKINTAGQEREKHLGPVLDKLTSDSPDDRLWATAATSHILSNADTNTRRALQSKNIVGLLINLLGNQNEVNEVKVEACGALRDLAIEGGAEVCAEMFNKQIVTKLQPQITIVAHALSNFLNDIKPKNEDEIRIRKVLWSWIEHLSTLFWCLAETSDKAFKTIVTIQPLSDLLYQILKEAVPIDGSSSSKIPANVALAAAQAVYVLTDVNVPSAPQFPLPRDVSKSAAYSNTRSMLLESLRTLSTSLESSSSSSSSSSSIPSEPTSSSSSSSNINEQYQSLLVMFIGIYQNLTSQRSFGKSTAKANEEEQEQDFNRLTLRILISLISSFDIQEDSESAIKAFESLPLSSSTSTSSSSSSSTTTKNVSIESIQISPAKILLDRLENKYTRIRLALEILGELVAGIDGLLDPALLGEEEYEEWNGIQQQEQQSQNDDNDSEMETEDDIQSDHHHHRNGENSESQHNNGVNKHAAQKPLLISKDIRSLLAELPAILLLLGKSSSISFTSPAAITSNKYTPQTESNLISTQIEIPESNGASNSNSDNQDNQKGTYVPALSEIFSFVHVRALECLNNLLITLARSGISEDTEVKAENGLDEDGDDDEDIDEDEDDDDADLPEDMEEMLNGTAATAHNEEEEEEEMEAEDALQVNAKSNGNYLLDNLSTFQNIFEGLFHSLVDYQARYRNVIQGQLKQKDSRFESLQLVVEASVGCIWALTRLCNDHLIVGQDEHRLLLTTLDTSLQQPRSFDIAIRCVGALGQLAVRQSVSTEENETIGRALLSQLDEKHLSQLNKDSIGEIDLCSQVLDTIFDVYGEETRSYDPVFGKLGFLNALSNVLPTFKRLTKSVDKRKYPDTREAAEAALLNLPAFITYRKQVQKKA